MLDPGSPVTCHSNKLYISEPKVFTHSAQKRDLCYIDVYIDTPYKLLNKTVYRPTLCAHNSHMHKKYAWRPQALLHHVYHWLM